MPDVAAGSGFVAGSPWRWIRAVAVAFAILFVIVGIWSAVLNLFDPSGWDFLSFWAAGRLVLQGHAALAYNISAHGAVENSVAHIGGRMPFPYPPPFLAIVTPFSLAPFGIAFILWIATTAIFYGFAISRIAPLPIAFGNTPACIDLMIGQNGFLVTGIFALGLTLIESSPYLAGATLGLMIFKPQLALLLPVAMLAGREWRVIAGAAVSLTGLLVIAALLFGLSSYEGFWKILPHYVELLRDNKEPWNELISPFALARFAGVPQTSALLIHVAVATAATAATARAWWLKLDQRTPILAAASLLISPYSYTYDALLIVLPLGWLVTHRQHPIVVAVAWLCCFIPIMTYFSPWLGPNYISVAAVICLVALHAIPKKRSAADSQTLSTVAG